MNSDTTPQSKRHTRTPPPAPPPLCARSLLALPPPPEQRAIAQKQGVHFTPDARLGSTARPIAWIKTRVTVAPDITVCGGLPTQDGLTTGVRGCCCIILWMEYASSRV